MKRVAAVPGDEVEVDAQSLAVTVNGVPQQREASAFCADAAAREAVRDRVARARAAGLPQRTTLREGQVFVLGDCADVSIDSRVWGPLDLDNLKARPLTTVLRK